MYKVRFLKQIHSCCASVATGDVFLKKDIELSFVPQKDINYYSDDWESGEVAEISFNIDTQQFKVYCEEDMELYNAELHRTKNPRRIEEIVKEYLELGWEIRE